MEIIRPIVQEWCIPQQYTASPEIIKNCLQEVLEEGILKSQVSAPVNDEDMTKKQRENIIKKHMEQYTTKYYESDNRWHSFLPDEKHPRKMKPIAKRKWEDLEQVIVDYYMQQEQSEKRKKMTLRTLYPEWFSYKWQDTNNSSYMNHIDYDWKRFYEDDNIIDRPIVEFTTLELKNWARGKIISEKLTKKVYYNMAVIIRQSLEYLVERGELTTNPFSAFKINPSLFTPVEEKEAEYEVFSEEEEQRIKEYALQDFERNTELTTALAVVLNFSLGLRVGELVALKWKDLKGSYLHIRRMEQKQYEQSAEKKWHYDISVVEHTKSDAGYRTIYVVSSALEVFEKIKDANLKRGFSCGAEDYIFIYRGKRITSQSIDKKYTRYCKELGFVKKGNHKTRKTCLTKIADNPNINLKDAMQFGGHRDVQTYIKHYCFSRYSDEQKRNELEKTLNVNSKEECKKV
ncbi:MAG: tyrosine-type recombinase/integrase [Lachnospiraceae bacterium]|nr:tyrosine-type recombinase/integrase [Lachnospiraceae bacterium]